LKPAENASKPVNLIVMSAIASIGIYGTGNVAWNLGRALSAHVRIKAVYGRNPKKAAELARALNCVPINEVSGFSGLDLVLCAVSDDATAKVVESIVPYAPAASTSGTIDILRLTDSDRAAVFYPMQSFRRETLLSLDSVPVFVEAGNEALGLALEELGNKLTGKAVRLPAESRKQLHLSAVFINNFATHMIATGQRLAKDAGLEPEWFLPLIRQLAAKLEHQPAAELLTGPAARGDMKTIAGHLALLNTGDAALYKTISDHIISQYHPHD
jgi:predicted short-subunit dehydrogenase-like oxidoreductase (DUF2520 family)